jgi:hypothetical protein
MSNRRLGGGEQYPLRWLEQRITRDIRIPLCEADLEMEDGWRCVPIPPDLDDDWFVVDSSSDRKTVWGCWRYLTGGHP